ncbi:MAG: branched-chain amino acid aminotransferase [Planctomycetes bacterium]|nr:branched-chain amino acid aminotransferase [Planctomycetota bacterium]
MKTLKLLWSDDAGFIISAELVLVATVAVLAMVVGLAEVGSAVNQELEDVGSAVGSVQQSFYYSGVESRGKAAIYGSGFNDAADTCDSQFDLVPTDPVGEDGDGISYHDRYGSE